MDLQYRYFETESVENVMAKIVGDASRKFGVTSENKKVWALVSRDAIKW